MRAFEGTRTPIVQIRNLVPYPLDHERAVSPRGVEPLSHPSEGCILSTEIWRRGGEGWSRYHQTGLRMTRSDLAYLPEKESPSPRYHTGATRGIRALPP